MYLLECFQKESVENVATNYTRFLQGHLASSWHHRMHVWKVMTSLVIRDCVFIGGVITVNRIAEYRKTEKVIYIGDLSSCQKRMLFCATSWRIYLVCLLVAILFLCNPWWNLRRLDRMASWRAQGTKHVLSKYILQYIYIYPQA